MKQSFEFHNDVQHKIDASFQTYNHLFVLFFSFPPPYVTPILLMLLLLLLLVLFVLFLLLLLVFFLFFLSKLLIYLVFNILFFSQDFFPLSKIYNLLITHPFIIFSYFFIHLLYLQLSCSLDSLTLKSSSPILPPLFYPLSFLDF